MKLQGRVTAYVNGEKVVDNDLNSIKAGLKAYFRDIMDSFSNHAIDDLFDTGDQTFGGTDDGQDGIVAISTSRGERTMVTTTLTPDNTYGKKWRGEYTNTTGANETISNFQIGKNFNSTTDPYFQTPYADYNPTDITLNDQDTLVLEWEIYIN